MINNPEETRSITDFKKNTQQLIKDLQQSGKPMVLTNRGKEEIVIQDVESYKQLLDIVDKIETYDSLQKGITEMRSGLGIPIDEAIAKIKQKFQLD